MISLLEHYEEVIVVEDEASQPGRMLTASTPSPLLDRKFEPLIVEGPHPQAAWLLGEIAKLYDIEDRARDMTNGERLALRQFESRPIVTRIRFFGTPSGRPYAALPPGSPKPRQM